LNSHKAQKANILLKDLFFLVLWGGAHSLCMPVLRPASQAGPMLNPRDGTSVVVARHHSLMVCVV